MIYEFCIKVNGEPIPLSRPRFRRVGKTIMTYNSQAKEENKFKKDVENQLDDITKIIIEKSKIENCYVELDMKFYVSIQATGSKKTKALKEEGKILPNIRPDIDNYIKFVMDSLHDVIYDDDKIVTGISAHKYYSENPRTELNIRISY